MAASIGKQIRALAADGRFGVRDLEKAATSMVDGRGVTRTEKKDFVKAFKEISADKKVSVTPAAKDAFAALTDRMRGFSQSKNVFAPTLNKQEVKDIIRAYSDRAPVYSGGESGRSGGGESGRTGGGRRTSGGEYGRTGGGESGRTGGGRRTSGGESFGGGSVSWGYSGGER